VVPAGAVEPLDGVVAPLDGAVPPLAVVLELVVDEVLELVAVAVLDAIACVGTVNGGAPAVFEVEVSPPPHAVRPTPRARTSTTARRYLALRATG
jgi:hypothetical protein